ncbi:MAG: SBBP repeat-containing protein [Caldisericia bacterium]|nr:SBBP repeat-containing protein [Caldisericia bacterium]
MRKRVISPKCFHIKFLVCTILIFTLVGCQSEKNGMIPLNEPITLSPLSIPELEFSTYFGGEWNDSISVIKMDKDGNIYLGGETDSSDFPIKNAFQNEIHGNTDAFLAKISSDGKLLWSTYLGGLNEFNHSPSMNWLYSGDMGELNEEVINSIVVTDEVIYVGGYTHAESFPDLKYSMPHQYWFLNSFIAEFTTDGRLINTMDIPYIEKNGYLVLQDFQWINEDTIIMTGIQALWEDKLNGERDYCIASLHFDEHEMGNSLKLNWKHTIPSWKEDQENNPEENTAINRSLFSKRFSKLSLSLYNDQIYIACTTEYPGYQERKELKTEANYLRQYGYIACYDVDGETIWDQYLKGKERPEDQNISEKPYVGHYGNTFINNIVVNTKGVYVAGSTVATPEYPLPKQWVDQDFPPNSMDQYNGFIAKMSHEGILKYTRLIGGNNREEISDMVVSPDERVWIIGTTQSKNFPLVNQMQDSLKENQACFVSVFSPNLKLEYSTYWAGQGYESTDEEKFTYDVNDRMRTSGEYILVDSNSFIITGETTSNTFTVKNAFQENHFIKINDVNTSIFLSFFTFQPKD